MPQVEEPERFIEVVEGFLETVERSEATVSTANEG
jgi:hypothetical protein